MESALRNQRQWEGKVKRSAEALKRKPEYQILWIAGVLATHRELAASKVIGDKTIRV